MKRGFLALVLASSLPLVSFAPQTMKHLLLVMFAACFAIASLSMPPLHYRRAGWPTTRNTLLTLATQTTACFFSTVYNIAYRPETTTAVAVLAANTYLFIRLTAEATALAAEDQGMAASAIILGLCSFITYIVSLLELFKP
ncbi:MAG: hypothetical protein N3H84_01790 [Candidatus Caldarchaeum sp.]|nr:hypothetical protein [Candidatus Caldarchaeum sp.]MCX8200822.1 hypothetical protein [Candidatus Caldarchaeum sp.]MDW8434804.1 hypothetical protein [Candidatus Caldarchaeum sp.]